MWRFAAPSAASTSTTRLPSVARKIPTFAATRLLPTPPLPPPIATTCGIIERAHNRAGAIRSSAVKRWMAGSPGDFQRADGGSHDRRVLAAERAHIEPYPAVLDPADHRHRSASQRRV